MSQPTRDTASRFYDRDFLLSEAKRNQLMELWEVRKFGSDSFADPDYVCIYGMRPDEWYGRGVRLLARTTLEAVRDGLGDLIGQDVARVVAGVAPGTRFAVIDPFAGSCNGLYWILRHLPKAEGLGCEFDPTIFELTRRNLALLDLPITLVQGDFRSQIAEPAAHRNAFLVVFVAPPWGHALDRAMGLDLGRTHPPVGDVVEHFEGVFARNPILYVTQTHQNVVPESLADYRSRFEWSDLRIYDIDAEGMKHGIILGSKRWSP